MRMDVMEMGANQNIILDDPNAIYIVQQGSVGVYAARLVNGEPSADRIHLFQGEIGQALLGMKISIVEDQIVLLITGNSTGARVEKRTLPQMLSFAREATDKIFWEPFIYLVESWIMSVSGALVKKKPSPQRFAYLPAGCQAEFVGGEVIRPRQDVIWIKIQAGYVKYIGEEHIPITPADTWFPLTEEGWIIAREKSLCRTILTEMMMDFAIDPDGSVLLLGIQMFHQKMLEVLKHRFNERDQQERERLQRKRNNEIEVVADAFSRLADTIEYSKAKLTVENGNDPFLAAIRLVAASANIQVKVASGYQPSQIGDFNLQGLQMICQASQFKYHKVILKNEWWKKDNGPLLAFTETGNPVALVPKTPSCYKYFDTVTGANGIVTDQQAFALRHDAYMFFRPLPNHALSLKDILVFCFKSVWISDLILFLFAGAALGGLGMLTPIATGKLMEDIVPSADQAQLLLMGGALLVSVVIGAIFHFVQSISHIRLEGGMNLALEAAIWDRILGLPVTFFRNFSVGDLANRVMGVNMMRQALSGAAISVVQSSLFSGFNLILLFFYDIKLALVALLLVCIYMLFIVVNTYIQFLYKKEMMSSGGNMSALMWQLMNGIGKLRLTGAENRAFALWAKQFAVARMIGVKARQNNYLTFLSSGINTLFQLVIFYCTTLFEVSAAQYMAFSAAFSTYISSMVTLSSTMASIVDIGPLYLRTVPILKAVPEVVSARRDPGELTGDIFLSHVYFRYHQDKPDVLKDISFRVKKGEYVAIIGPSGCGKSTLFRLLLGFEHPQAGNVMYDGQNLKDINIQFVRSQIGVVLQNGQLMTGDILTNIIGTSDLTLEDAWEAAKMAGIDEDIRNMPMGMYTLVSEESSSISGGQRQRLLIARALAKKTRMIFFDEATSALDNRTQATVINSLESLKVTRIVIAHRLSTIVNADRILVMENGQIVQSGTYRELMKQKGLFFELARRQLA